MFSVDKRPLVLAPDELEGLVSECGDPAETLSNLVSMVGNRFESDVCSAYLLDSDGAGLVLSATVGLRQSAIGRIRMRLDEGLAGLVAEQKQPVAVADAFEHPRFKYFPESGEDPFHSFLGVPILDRGELVGVLVVQTHEPREFSRDETQSLAGLGRQVAPLVAASKARLQSVPSVAQRSRVAACKIA